MLRECQRVLKPGGRLAFYVIHFQPGISPSAKTELMEALPGMIDSPAPYQQMVEQAGFEQIEASDVTTQYRLTAETWLREAADLEPGLRAAFGDDVFEDRHHTRKVSMKAIESGDLGRTLFTAQAPA